MKTLEIPDEVCPHQSYAPFTLYVDSDVACGIKKYGVVGYNHAGEYVFFLERVSLDVATFFLHCAAAATGTGESVDLSPIAVSEIRKHNDSFYVGGVE